MRQRGGRGVFSMDDSMMGGEGDPMLGNFTRALSEDG